MPRTRSHGASSCCFKPMHSILCPKFNSCARRHGQLVGTAVLWFIRMRRFLSWICIHTVRINQAYTHYVLHARCAILVKNNNRHWVGSHRSRACPRIRWLTTTSLLALPENNTLTLNTESQESSVKTPAAIENRTLSEYHKSSDCMEDVAWRWDKGSDKD